tara:strand:- start:133 stop:465 length:333 start_codon:yes stop_codon:yes gene_type:complete
VGFTIISVLFRNLPDVSINEKFPPIVELPPATILGEHFDELILYRVLKTKILVNDTIKINEMDNNLIFFIMIFQNRPILKHTFIICLLIYNIKNKLSFQFIKLLLSINNE